MAGPMVLLYLLSIGFAWMFGKKRKPAEEASYRRRAGELDRLLAASSAADATQREAAVARLRVQGARALPHLAALDRLHRAGAGTRGARSRRSKASTIRAPSRLARTALQRADAGVALAAVAVLRGWLTREDGTQVLEAITATALDKRRDAAVRLAALDALSELPPELVAPVRERAPIDTGAQPALDDPAALRAWLAEHAASAPLSALHAAVTGAREREQGEPAGRRRDEWTRVRGAAHVALAHRGSRVAVYDLRESFDRARDPLPADFLAAAARVGDDSCLEPMARAWAEAAERAVVAQPADGVGGRHRGAAEAHRPPRHAEASQDQMARVRLILVGSWALGSGLWLGSRLRALGSVRSRPRSSTASTHPAIGYDVAAGRRSRRAARAGARGGPGARSTTTRARATCARCCARSTSAWTRSWRCSRRPACSRRSSARDNPRTIFFNDWWSWRGRAAASIELAAQDPAQGVAFYMLDQRADADAARQRASAAASICHVSYATLNVPGLLVRSVATAPDGAALPFLANATPDHRTPFEERWAGWFVTGSASRAAPSRQRHRGRRAPADRGRDARRDRRSRRWQGRFDTDGLPVAAQRRGRASGVHAPDAHDEPDHADRLADARGARRPGRPTPRAAAAASLAVDFVDYLLFVDEPRAAGAGEGRVGIRRAVQRARPARSPAAARCASWICRRAC